MSDMDNTILHEAATREVIEDELTEAITDGDLMDTAGTVAAMNAAFIAGQGAAIADASEAHALNAVFSDTEVEGALNTIAGKLNDVLAALRSFNIIDT
jgi:hypothetical protein